MDHNKNLSIFITHGRDLEAKKEVIKWLRYRKPITINTVDLAKFITPGETTHLKMVEIATECDAAIILATADDFGYYKGDVKLVERARQNVWMELGWFWAKLGLKRTLLLIKGNVEVPSNLHGVTYIKYENSITEVSDLLKQFINSLYQQKADSLTEVIYFSTDVNQSDSQFSEIHKSAKQNLSILGIANARLTSLLPNTLTQMRKPNSKLVLELLVMNPAYCQEIKKILEKNHGSGTVSDNARFYHTLKELLQDFPSLDNRIIVHAYSCLPNFGIVAADGESVTGSMLVRPFKRRARNMGFNYPQFKLKNRSESGAFNVFWNSIQEIKDDKSICITLESHSSIIDFVNKSFYI